MKINKDVDRENTTRIDYDYRVGDKVMKNTRSAYKHKTLFRGPYKSVWKWKKQDSNLTNRSGYAQNKQSQHQALQ